MTTPKAETRNADRELKRARTRHAQALAKFNAVMRDVAERTKELNAALDRVNELHNAEPSDAR